MQHLKGAYSSLALSLGTSNRLMFSVLLPYAASASQVEKPFCSAVKETAIITLSFNMCSCIVVLYSGDHMKLSLYHIPNISFKVHSHFHSA